MRKTIYHIIMALLTLVIFFLAIMAISIKINKGVYVVPMYEKQQIKQEDKPSGGIEIIETPQSRPNIDIDTSTSASEYKNFEDTIDELIELTK